MFIIKFFFICVMAILPVTAYSLPNFSTTEATSWADTKGHQILTILTESTGEEKYTQLDEILKNDIDLDNAAKFVVGKYWKKMSDKQKQTYIPIFKNYVSNIYRSYSLDIKKGSVKYVIKGTTENKNTIDVHCNIEIADIEKHVDNKSKGGINVIFSLVKNKGKIQVQDLKIEESSLLVSLRNRFYKMIHDSDEEIDWFLEDLQTLVDDNMQQNDENLDS